MARIQKDVLRIMMYYYHVHDRLPDLVKKLKEDVRMWGVGNGTAKALATLREINTAMRCHGVEHIRTENGRWEAYYVNGGDTYSPTVMIQTRPRVSVIVAKNWGDYVERYDS